MNKRTHTIRSLAALAGLMLAASSAHGATITNTNAAWPGKAGAQTLDVLGVDPTPGNRYLQGTRELRQTFQVASDFTVRSIFLSVENYNNLAFKITIWEVANMDADPWVAGTLVKSITVDSLGGPNLTGFRNLEIRLTDAEQFLLAQRNAGTTGYGMELVLVDTTTTEPVFGWSSTFGPGAGPGVPGRFYRETGLRQPVDIDAGLALVSGSEPEPRSWAWRGLGATGPSSSPAIVGKAHHVPDVFVERAPSPHS